jgi:hypothetical protein
MSAPRIGWTLAVAAAVLAGTALAKVETWRQEGSAAFSKHHRERVVVSDQGRVRLGQALTPAGSLGAERVWDLVRSREGKVFAATGDSGKVFQKPEKEGSAWNVALDAVHSQALTLAATPDGKVFVGTGPSGLVIEVTDPKNPNSRPDTKIQYIWDLASDAKGNLYAATGPTGQLWKRDKNDNWSLLLDSKATHLLCVAVAPDGTVYAGSDGEGLIYRVAPDGKVSVLYDAPQSEVRCLLVAPDGSLYAGTAAEASGGSANRAPALFSMREDGADSRERGAGHREAMRGLAQVPPTRPRSSAGGPPPAGSAAPKAVSPGDNSVYRIDSEGVAREVLRAKALFFALCWADDRLLVGTGPDGQLFELRGGGSEMTPLAKLDNGQVLSMLALPGDGILLGTGDPGSVVRLSSGFVAQGELVSEVHDTKLPSRFGALSWRADVPPGTSIAVQVRTGNVGVPDETWSAWSAEQTDPATARAGVPPGRFAQYRVKLSTRDPGRTPELSSVALSYRSSNLAPELSKVEVPDLNAADGTTRQTRLSIRWDVSDPNDDELQSTVQVRKEGWPSWIVLTDPPIAEKSYSWDTTAFPSGLYRVRVSVSDRPSNSPEEAHSRDRESTSFVVDHDPPQVEVSHRDKQARIDLSDGLTRLVKAEYALDGGPWTPLFPDDGLFDTSREQITLSLPDLKPGVHLLMVRATDAAGNLGSGDSLLGPRN